MAYYVLKVEQTGPRSYGEAAKARHMINACSLNDAKDQADEIAEDKHPKGDFAALRLFDETGLAATRTASGLWDV